MKGLAWTAGLVLATIAIATSCAEGSGDAGPSGEGGSAGAPGSGGSGAEGGGGPGGAGSGGMGATGGGGSSTGSGVCPAILIEDGIPSSCNATGDLESPHENTTPCPEDVAVFWPAKIYKVKVKAGDCVHMRADNVGSIDGADLFGAIVEPSGKSNLFDDEVDCTVDGPEGYGCPDGSAETDADGDAFVMVGAWEGDGCIPGDITPFQVTISLNGVDVDLSGGELCAGDLQEIIP